MKKKCINVPVFFVVVLYFFLWPNALSAAHGDSPKSVKSLPVKTVPPPIVIDVARLRADIAALTAITPPRCFKNVHSLNKAADYIYQSFKKCGGRVRYQEFKVKGKVYKNVIALFGPLEGERLILGAHYDVCGEQPGADDNGSGTAALLELARLLHNHRPDLARPVELVAYTLEEPPNFRSPNMGSAVHARSLVKKGDRITLMVSIDMIGYFSGKEKLEAIADFLVRKPDDRANAVTVAGKRGDDRFILKVRDLMSKGNTLDVVPLIAPMGTKSLDWSDHLNYWRHGFPAVFVTTCYVGGNPNYHSVKDTIDTLDFPKLAEVIKGLYNLLLHYR
ncbi:MAG: M28 family peptidase [bacterium]|nr:M28 family peptidase [bacterium]